MKKTDLIRCAMIGIIAALCVSGQIAHKGNQIAMTKCYKPEKSDKSEMPAKEDHAEDQQNGDQEDMSKLEKQKTKLSDIKGKSAARRVIEGIDISDASVPRKSAAKQAIEAEMRGSL